MKILKNQILASTCLDKQGEQYDKEFFEDMVKAINTENGGRLPLNQMHDFSKPPVGYADNLRLKQDPEDPSIHYVIGDMVYDESLLECEPKCMSFSMTVAHEQSRLDGNYTLYLPHPHYNDLHLIADLNSADPNLMLGKWIKKSVLAGGTALLVAGAVISLHSTWENFFTDLIWPKIKNAFSHAKKLRSLNITFDFVQPVKTEDGNTFPVFFLYKRGYEDLCYDAKRIKDGISLVQAYVSDHANTVTAAKLRMNAEKQCYEIYSIHYNDNTAKHFND